MNDLKTITGVSDHDGTFSALRMNNGRGSNHRCPAARLRTKPGGISPSRPAPFGKFQASALVVSPVRPLSKGRRLDVSPTLAETPGVQTGLDVPDLAAARRVPHRRHPMVHPKAMNMTPLFVDQTQRAVARKQKCVKIFDITPSSKEKSSKQ